jgi:transposase
VADVSNDLPPWEAVYQQTQGWLKARVAEAIVHGLRMLLRLAEGRQEHTTGAIMDSCTLQSKPRSGARAGYDGAKRKRGSKVHVAVDTLGPLLALHVAAADAQDRAYERLPATLAGLRFLAFVILLLKRFVALMAQSA